MALGSIDVCGDGLDWSHQKLLKDGNMEEIRKRKEEEEKQVIGAPLTPLRCPRCDSKNTKFCYYNNYSRSQPRHFCKSCRRHWTNGGTLRNVPVGGSRKNKRPKLSHPSANVVRKDQIFEDDNIGIDMKQSNLQVLQQEDEHHQHIQRFPLQFVPNSALLHPRTSSSSSSDYNNSTSMFGRNGSSALGSLLSSLPPILSPLMDPFFPANNSSLSLPQPQPTSGFFPLMKLMEENGDDQEDKFGLTTSSSIIDAEVASTVPWQSTNLLPMCSGLANVSSGLELSSTGGGGFWNCWDELTGFSTPQANHGLP